jgi:hypothetical protein
VRRIGVISRQIDVFCLGGGVIREESRRPPSGLAGFSDLPDTALLGRQFFLFLGALFLQALGRLSSFTTFQLVTHFQLLQ